MTTETGTSGAEAGPEGGSGSPNTAAGGPTDDAHGRRVAELAQEAGSYRTQRNTALRRAAAFETILKAHNIDTSVVTEDALAALPINAGAVDGVFQYTPPKPGTTTQPRVQARAAEPEGPGVLTREAIEAMTPDEINRRWDEIKAFLRK